MLVLMNNIDCGRIEDVVCFYEDAAEEEATLHLLRLVDEQFDDFDIHEGEDADGAIVCWWAELRRVQAGTLATLPVVVRAVYSVAEDEIESRRVAQ